MMSKWFGYKIFEYWYRECVSKCRLLSYGRDDTSFILAIDDMVIRTTSVSTEMIYDEAECIRCRSRYRSFTIRAMRQFPQISRPTQPGLPKYHHALFIGFIGVYRAMSKILVIDNNTSPSLRGRYYSFIISIIACFWCLKSARDI